MEWIIVVVGFVGFLAFVIWRDVRAKPAVYSISLNPEWAEKLIENAENTTFPHEARAAKRKIRKLEVQLNLAPIEQEHGQNR